MDEYKVSALTIKPFQSSAGQCILSHNHQKDKQNNQNIARLLSILLVQVVTHQQLPKKR